MMWSSVFMVIVCLQFHATKAQTAASDGNDKYQFIHGRDGASGRDGRDGIIGSQGPPGFPGFPGHKGGQGEQGKLGPRGQKGGIGDTITSTGPRGLTGSPGIQGPKGSSGSLGQKGGKGSQSGGTTYIRWGKTSCRSGANLVYSGRVGGSLFSQAGGSNYVCMPDAPEYSLLYTPGVQGASYMYGVEYESTTSGRRNNHNAVCAVCYLSDKATSLMIPAKTNCFSGWTREYYGYLMSEHQAHKHRTQYACVDINLEPVPGSQSNIVSGHFYHVEGHCDGVPCPPYNNYKELNCVVCSK